MDNVKISKAETFLKNICANKSIAVVGSGPLNEYAGNIIDEHDIVFRINRFDTTYNPQKTGIKLSCWIHNGHLGETTPIISNIPHIVTKAYQGELINEFNKMITYHKLENIYFFSLDTINKLDSMVSNKALTTGSRILSFLLSIEEIVNSITAFGFTFYDWNLPIYEMNHHKVKTKKESISKWHSPKSEKAFFTNYISNKFKLIHYEP